MGAKTRAKVGANIMINTIMRNSLNEKYQRDPWVCFLPMGFVANQSLTTKNP